MSKLRIELRLTHEVINQLKTKKKNGIDYSDYVSSLIMQDMLNDNVSNERSHEMFRDIKLIRRLITEQLIKTDKQAIDKIFQEFVQEYPKKV